MMVTKLHSPPGKRKLLPLPTKHDLQLMNKAEKQFGQDKQRLAELLGYWHHELAMPVGSISHKCHTTAGRIQLWLAWHGVREITSVCELPVRAPSVIREIRAKRRAEYLQVLAISSRQTAARYDEDGLATRLMNDLASVPLLTCREEWDLANLVRHGIPQDSLWASNEMTEANGRFICSIAQKYVGYGLMLSDLIQEGAVGCRKAAQRFDATRGFRFISYAVWWIRQAMAQALAEKSRIVRLPMNRIGLAGKISKKVVRLQQDLMREPNFTEIAKELGVSEAEIALTRINASSEMSLDEPFKNSKSDANNLLDVLEDESTAAPYEQMTSDGLRLEIEKVLDTLTAREAEVISLYFGLYQPALHLEEIGAQFSLTRERIRQIKEKAIRRLRHSSRSFTLRAYLDQEILKKREA